jgi:hypothetical protein
LADNRRGLSGAAGHVINHDFFEENLTKSRTARFTEATGAGKSEADDEKQA